MRESILIFTGYCVLLFAIVFFQGCGSGKEDDQQETSSSESNVQVFDCSGAAQVSPEQVEALEEAADAGDEESAEKLAVIGNCNTVNTQDDHSTSDDDVTTDIGGNDESA